MIHRNRSVSPAGCWIISTLVVVYSFFGDSAVASAQNDQRPDVLIIAVDDLNDWISSLVAAVRGTTGGKSKKEKRVGPRGLA